MDLTVMECWAEGANIRGLTLAAADHGPLPTFEPGAHVELSLPDGQMRPYSLVDLDGCTAAPRTWVLAVLLQPESRGGSRYVHGLARGDRLRSTLPKNTFALAADPSPALLVAGGIGITPIMTMARALHDSGRPYRLVYAARSRAHMAFADHLAAVHGDALVLHLDDAAGRPLPLADLFAQTNPGTHFYVCGPRPMVEAARNCAFAAGHVQDHVHVELFAANAPRFDDRTFEVELSSSGQVFTVPPDRSIIDVLESAGIDLMHDCRRGDCGICRTTVLVGTPDHRDVVLTASERNAGRVMQICVSRALSPRLKLDL